MKRIISLTVMLFMMIFSFPVHVSGFDERSSDESQVVSIHNISAVEDFVEIAEYTDENNINTITEDNTVMPEITDDDSATNPEVDAANSNINDSIFDEVKEYKTQQFNGNTYYFDGLGNLYLNGTNENNRIYNDYNITNLVYNNEKLYAVTLDSEVELIDVSTGETKLSPENGDSVELFASSNEKQVFDYLTGTMKLNSAAACGVLSNIRSESGFDPNVYGDNGTSYGICQWHNSRFTNLKNYCNKHGYNYKSLSGQLKFLNHELSNSYKGTLNYLKKVSNSANGAYNAGYYWCYHFERPANKGSVSVKRGNYAKNTYWPKYGNAKPSKPTITKCSATGATSIKVEWDKVSGASKYKIVRHEVDGANKKTLTDKCTSTSYTDKGLISGHTYYYIVYAYGNNKWSDASTEWKTYTAPATPKQPEVNRDVPKQLTITWNKVDGATKYKLEYHRADTSGWTTLDSNIKTTSYTHKNLADGTKYNYRVTAIREGNIGRADKKKNQKVESGASPTKTKFTQMARPSNDTNDDNTSQVILKWNAVKGSKGYSYAYNVYRDGAKINSSLVTGTTYTDNKAVSGKIHNYQIEIMEKGDTSNTYIGRGKTALYAGSKITKEITVVPQSNTEMKISWSAPASAPSGTKYTLLKYNSSKKQYETLKTNITTTSYIDKGLKAGETYRYAVQVYDKDNNKLTGTFGTATKLDIVASKITLNKSEVSLNEGETVNLTATITPENCFDKTVRWASLNEGVASVDANGLVTAKTAGTAEITATTSNNQTAKCVVTVNSTECTHEYEGENEGWIIDTAATCEEAGSRHRVCKKCSETETETIAATGHQYSEEYQTVKEATCTEAGEQARVCSVCNAQIDNIPIEATGHKFGDTWLVEKGATCDEQGIEYRQCSVCGEKETRDIDTTTHDYELTEKTDVTPDGPGHITYTCKICGESYTEEYVPEINEGTISIGDGSLKAGGTITLPVTIENNPGIAGFNFTLDYDKSVMTPTAITKGGLIPEGTTFTSNLEQGIPASELKEVSVYWGASSNVTEDGELFNITFDVTGGTTDGLYPISLKYEKGDITDAAFNDVMPTIIDNVVTIADVMRGDVNLDRRVDSQDELLLSRYIAKWNLEFNDNQKKAANVFADSAGTINSKDGVRLSQILSGYELIDSGEAASLMASKEVDISLGEAEVTAGDYISVPVMITGNEGIAGFNFTLNYDKEYLTPVAIEKGEMLVDGNFTSNLTEETDGSSLDYVTAYWNCAYDMAEDGELFSVDFIVSDNAIVGQQLPIEISCEDGSLCDYTLSDVSVTLTQDNLNVIEDIQEDPVDEINLTPYEIANVSMTLNDGTICEEIPVNGDFNLDVLLYETTGIFNPATMMIGLYDDNGALINMQYDNITEEMISSDENFNIHIDETSVKIKDIKIFVWNSTNELEPLSDIFELVNQESN